MAHQHTRSTSSVGQPHAVSLKVLRLSRPSLATQTALPPTHLGGGLDIPRAASLAYPSTTSSSASNDNTSGSFPLTPLLTLPPAFGAAYVGEAFTCTLCANNEVQAGDGRRVTGVKIAAELQTPSGNEKGAEVELFGADGERVAAQDEAAEMDPGATLQRTLRCELKDEGPHQLAVTVTYTEQIAAAMDGGGSRSRTFRKLYQFVAQPLLAVRSKVTERKRRDARRERRQWVLEAQVENVGETSVVLERVSLGAREGLEVRALNEGADGATALTVALKPQDIEQVMFLLTEQSGVRIAQEEVGVGGEGVPPGRLALAQVHVDWRAAMGEKGSLTTGWLASRGR